MGVKVLPDIVQGNRQRAAHVFGVWLGEKCVAFKGLEAGQLELQVAIRARSAPYPSLQWSVRCALLFVVVWLVTKSRLR